MRCSEQKVWNAHTMYMCDVVYQQKVKVLNSHAKPAKLSLFLTATPFSGQTLTVSECVTEPFSGSGVPQHVVQQAKRDVFLFYALSLIEATCAYEIHQSERLLEVEGKLLLISCDVE